MATPTRISIKVDEATAVSGLLECPRGAKICLVFAHGAGAGMQHPFMNAFAQALAASGIATLRYQFPYMERAEKRPDAAPLCRATVRAAANAAREHLPKLALIAGGKSFGGRMTSQAQAETPLMGVAGLVFVGFPLHAAGKPGTERAAHLSKVKIPMLFLQGTNDKLADPALLQPIMERLCEYSTVQWLEGADHSFHVPVRSGRTDAQVSAQMIAAILSWCESIGALV
jgi:uncharacterized protein